MSVSERFAAFLEDFSESRIEQMSELFAEELDFKDPLNEAITLDHLKKIEHDLFKQLKEIRFEVTSRQEQGEEAFVAWIMRYRFRLWQREIEGCSHIKFNAEGKITFQRDYWDASFPIYGEFPPLGFLMKGIKKLLSVKP